MASPESSPVVSRLEKVARRGEYLVTFSDGTQLRILKDHLADTGIEEGSRVERDHIAELDAAYRYARARQAALRLLKVRPRTELELKRRLGSTRPGPGTVDRVIADLKAEGLIDDRVFARLWVREKVQRGDSGRKRIRRDLEARGIDRDVVSEVLGRFYDASAETEAARALALRRIDRMGALPAPEAKRRVYAHLLRKGFGSDTAAEAARYAAGRARDTDDDEI
jgi:regulatory protein